MHRHTSLLVAAATVLALTACSGGAPDGSGASDPAAPGRSAATELSGSLEIWTDGTKHPAVKAIVADFTEDYPGVEVDLVSKNFSDIGPDFITQVPTGNGPDIIVTPHDGLGNMRAAGVIAPVELGPLADQLNPVAVEAFTIDGQTYGVPYAIENVGLVRNNELTQDTPQTWKELLISAEAVDGTDFDVVMNVTEDGDPYHMYPLQTSFGSEVFARSSDGSYQADLTLGDQAGVEFASWLAGQGPDGTGAFDPSMTADVAKEAFLDGRAPYFITGPWDGTDFREKKMDVDVLPIPSAGGEPARPFVGVQGFVISAESENQLLANEFLTGYVGSTDGQLELFRHGPGTPALTEAAESGEVVDDPLNAGFAAAGEDGVPMPSIPEMAHTWVLWGRAEVAILKGADPKKTWKQMADNIATEIDTN